MLDNLNSIQNLTKIEVLIKGNWLSPIHGNRTWQGEAVAETPIVSIVFLSCKGQNFWAKSSLTRSNALNITLDLHPLRDRREIQFIYSVGGSNPSHNVTATLSSEDYLPDILPLRIVQSGTLVTIARFDSIPAVDLSALFLSKHDVKVARKHIWGLRKALLVGLPLPLVEVLSHGRKGEFPN